MQIPIAKYSYVLAMSSCPKDKERGLTFDQWKRNEWGGTPEAPAEHEARFNVKRPSSGRQ
jgi:hypothetical protein